MRLNLLLNARDAMPTGGAIELLCTADPSSQQTVAIRVRDTGEGISEDVRARIFEPFFTTKKERGTGLGLAMVWGVVTRAGGTITVDSKLGEGTTFSLHFPAVAAMASPAPTVPLAAKRDGSRRRVLLVEDEPDVLDAVARMLSRGTYDVAAFARAQPAIDSLATEHYDVLVTDVVVPDGGIPGPIAAFRQKHPGAPTLVCSGHVDEELVKAGIEAGDYQFLRKPFRRSSCSSASAHSSASERAPRVLVILGSTTLGRGAASERERRARRQRTASQTPTPTWLHRARR